MPMSSSVIILLFFTWIFKDSLEIRNVRLILPSVVQAGTSATLLCLYDLEGASLYSVQWYRGQFEFFRFVPDETPPAKVFRIPGLYVDSFDSNEHQVKLRNIPVQISGEFSCEITTDAPPFSTSCVSNNLTVIDFKLDLSTRKRQYRYGDIIYANCTITPRLPYAKFIFQWNNKPVPDEFVSQLVSDSVLLHLNTSVFDMYPSYTVTLKCLALLDNMYDVVSTSVSLQLRPSISFDKSKGSKLKLVFILLLPLCFLPTNFFFGNLGL